MKGRLAMRRHNMAARQTSGKAERGLRTDPSPLPPLQGELTENQDWARAHHRGSLSAAEPSRSSERDPCKAAAPRTSSHLGGQSRVSAARNERERPASSGREVTIARPARREGRSPQTLTGDGTVRPAGWARTGISLPPPRCIMKAPGPRCRGRPRLRKADLNARPRSVRRPRPAGTTGPQGKDGY